MKKKLFFIPIFGEFYLIYWWIKLKNYPLNLHPVLSGYYQGFWFAIILAIIILL